VIFFACQHTLITMKKGDVAVSDGIGRHGTLRHYFIGIEGGGTSSQGVLLDEKAQILAKCTGGKTNQWVIGLEKTCETIADMVGVLRRNGGVPDGQIIDAIGLCMSGADDDTRNKQWIEMLDDKFHLSASYVIENDSVGSLATARSDLAGIVLISGLLIFFFISSTPDILSIIFLS
jgi:N-acetylglucosamine kinase-like BadF-type ATPase